MRRPPFAFELGSLLGSLGKSENSRRPSARVGEHAIVEKLHFRTLIIFPQPRVGLLVKLPQTPNA
jgi:hypothetical protein